MPLAGSRPGLPCRLQLPLQFGDFRVLLPQPPGVRAAVGLLRGHVVLQALYLGALPDHRGRVLAHAPGDMRGIGGRLPGMRPQRRGGQRGGQRQPMRAAPHR